MENTDILLKDSMDELIKMMMSANTASAEYIYKLCKTLDKLDSQEFINWQDELNAISVKYK